jgi:hypothetical protein
MGLGIVRASLPRFPVDRPLEIVVSAVGSEDLRDGILSHHT